MKSTIKNTKLQLKYYMQIAYTLTLPYNMQDSDLLSLGDYLTEDIASDWLSQLNGAKELYSLELAGYINREAVIIYQMIVSNFDIVSYKTTRGKTNALYDNIIWTAEGFKTHTFWDIQRVLALKLFKMLKDAVGKFNE